MHLFLPEDGMKHLDATDREIFFRAFQIIERELGLADNPKRVRVCFNEVQVNGKYMLRGSLNRVTGNGPDDPYRIEIGHTGPMIGSMVQTLCHEMIHVQQHETDMLVDDPARTKENEIIWKGVVWTQERAEAIQFFSSDYDQIRRYPWEEDAHGRTPELFETVMLQLPDDDIAYIKKQISIRKGKSPFVQVLKDMLESGLGDVVGDGAIASGILAINKKTGEITGLDRVPPELRDELEAQVRQKYGFAPKKAMH